MPAVLRMISTAAALTLACIGRLPAARADLDSICATGIDEIFAEVAEQSSAELIAPGGCDAAAALALCDVHGTGGVCRDEPACTPELIQVNDDCTAVNEGNSCCAKLYRKPCETCAAEVFSCGQFCSDAPIVPYASDSASDTAATSPAAGAGGGRPALEGSGGGGGLRSLAGAAAAACAVAYGLTAAV